MDQNSWMDEEIKAYCLSKNLWERDLWRLTEEYFNYEVKWALKILGFSNLEIRIILFDSFQILHKYYSQLYEKNNPNNELPLSSCIKENIDNRPISSYNLEKLLLVVFNPLLIFIERMIKVMSPISPEFKNLLYSYAKHIEKLDTHVESYIERILLKDGKKKPDDLIIDKIVREIERGKEYDPQIKWVTFMTDISNNLLNHKMKSSKFLLALKDKLIEKHNNENSEQRKLFWSGVIEYWSTFLEKYVKTTDDSITTIISDDQVGDDTDRRYHKRGFFKKGNADEPVDPVEL